MPLKDKSFLASYGLPNPFIPVKLITLTLISVGKGRPLNKKEFYDFFRQSSIDCLQSVDDKQLITQMTVAYRKISGSAFLYKRSFNIVYFP